MFHLHSRSFSLQVANLPFTLDDEGLKKVFTDAGVEVATARIVKRKFGIKRSKGFGFVDTVSESEQQKGLAADGTEVEGVSSMTLLPSSLSRIRVFVR